jgi:hypothetical protein
MCDSSSFFVSPLLLQRVRVSSPHKFLIQPTLPPVIRGDCRGACAGHGTTICIDAQSQAIGLERSTLGPRSTDGTPLKLHTADMSSYAQVQISVGK